MPQTELAAVHGASGAIWALARSLLGPSVAIPLPAYTEYLRAFPTAVYGDEGLTYELDVIGAAVSLGRTVLISNPHNPSGALIPPEALLRIAASNPGGCLIVDESYSDFARRPGTDFTVVGTERQNVAAIHSPSKFYCIPGARAGVIWSRSEKLRQAFSSGENWPVSEIDALIAETALAEVKWAEEMRLRIASDRDWLVALLGDGNVVGTPQANFVMVTRSNAAILDASAVQVGLKVRVLLTGNGMKEPSVRITPPKCASH